MGICFFFIIIFFSMKPCCVFSLESPYRGDSDEYKQYIISNIYIKKSPKIIPSLHLWDFFSGDSRTSSNH